MPRFDPETIAALAEGRLSPDEAARVEAAIAQDPAALAELEMQRAAIAALATAPELHLTELERSGIRSSIADALGLVDTSTAAAEESRRVPWGALGVAAAALAGLVAVVPVVGLLNTSGSDGADTDIGAVATTSLDLADRSQDDAAAPVTDEVAAAPTGDGGFDASEEAPGEGIQGFGSSTTIATPTTTAEATSDSVEDTTSTTVTAESVPAAASIDQLLSDLGALHEDALAVEAVAAEALPENLCWTEDTTFRGGQDPGDRWSFEYDDGEKNVVVFFQYTSDGTPGPFTVYETVGCTAVAEIPDIP
jgi:hypothetical protein